MNKIRIGIVGYGNIGKGVARAVDAAADMELRAIFTRRNPDEIKLTDSKVSVLSVDNSLSMVGDIDVMMLCGGSATDLPVQGPHFAKNFNIVDSFDTHAKIPGYMAAIDDVATKTTAIISTGWDPGLFSIMRSLFESVLPDGTEYTFWGKGVSQGHSDAIRRIKGVQHAVQYTIPVESSVAAVRSGQKPKFKTRDKHTRECYVVAEPDADKEDIVSQIKNMPNYFSDYDTTVNFIDADELFSRHSGMPHGGVVLRSGATGNNSQLMEFSLNLDSNPEFTAGVMTAYARAAYRLFSEGVYGAKTVFDVPLSYLSPRDRNSLIRDLL